MQPFSAVAPIRCDANAKAHAFYRHRQATAHLWAVLALDRPLTPECGEIPARRDKGSRERAPTLARVSSPVDCNQSLARPVEHTDAISIHCNSARVDWRGCGRGRVRCVRLAPLAVASEPQPKKEEQGAKADRLTRHSKPQRNCVAVASPPTF
ncbi:hypothetical protein L1887_57240 [Cichorium endivia]|nr:hypothetical protein L1887_57240 [Cichorium endivia]